MIYPSIYNLKKGHFDIFQDTYTDTVGFPPPPLLKLLTRILRKSVFQALQPPNRPLIRHAKCSESRGGQSGIRTVSKAPSVCLQRSGSHRGQSIRGSRWRTGAPAVPREARATRAQPSERSRRYLPGLSAAKLGRNMKLLKRGFKIFFIFGVTVDISF